ncbi:hypothetical protein PoB_004654900 [Plakobranchus ocellatus]|uniref:Uncharacterized protein n=1 Tax=Plakobranchus ocellatus TaxID=259542 RepID=A0AAV4BIX2_9GAST|nr:hypothetical protein PoB_004654900 [Plakobranchus ocellatus]
MISGFQALHRDRAPVARIEPRQKIPSRFQGGLASHFATDGLREREREREELKVWFVGKEDERDPKEIESVADRDLETGSNGQEPGKRLYVVKRDLKR